MRPYLIELKSFAGASDLFRGWPCLIPSCGERTLSTRLLNVAMGGVLSPMVLSSSEASSRGSGPTPEPPVPAVGRAVGPAGGTAAGTAVVGAGPPRKQKFVYILGTGRCGSTIFEILLGSHPKIQATGEFHGLPFPKWMPGTICACGLTYNVCPFWSQVTEEVP